MHEKRRSERLDEENEITIEIVSKGKQPPKKNKIYHISKDISSKCARIQADTFLPVDTLVKIQLTLKHPPRMVTALGKIKWVRSLYADESFEAGLEFIDTASDTINLLAGHVAETTRP